LVALGRRKGHLTNQDLEAALPVDIMSPEDIALVVVHLEEAGVSVDLDETLLAPVRRAVPVHRNPTDILLPANDTGSPLPRRSDLTLSAVEVPPVGAPLQAAERDGTNAHKAVLLALILVFLLAVVALVMGR
jgi:hypothetical protein